MEKVEFWSRPVAASPRRLTDQQITGSGLYYALLLGIDGYHANLSRPNTAVHDVQATRKPVGKILDR